MSKKKRKKKRKRNRKYGKPETIQKKIDKERQYLDAVWDRFYWHGT
jgi:hypothetical protein